MENNQSITPTFNLLNQGGGLDKFLELVVKALPHMPESEAKQELIDQIKEFEDKVVLTSWDISDVHDQISGRDHEDRDEDTPILTDDEARSVLKRMVNDHECSNWDWDFIQSTYDALKESSEL